jgi:hypothetical protein
MKTKIKQIEVVRATHRKIHYHLASWMQGQGARLSK